ncbi:hypothetical protein M3J09_003920 [Ascochyta lentis]
MGKFEEAVQTEVFKECISILLGWNAPFHLGMAGRAGGSVRRRVKYQPLPRYA